jgi:tRNA-splicing ligase RtcB
MSDAPSIFGEPIDQRALQQIENCLRDDRAVAGALMADHHLGYSMPIGGVVAYRDAISPSGVGFDIACGNKAARTELEVDFGIKYDLGRLMGDIRKQIAFGIGRSNAEPIDHDLFDDPLWSEIDKLVPGLQEKARAQLGTVGSGNHYVDLLVDEDGRLWAANHFGSRGFGHTVATTFLNLAAGRAPTERAKDEETPAVLDLGTETGDLYMEAMKLAGRYAYAGRDYVMDQVLRILGTKTTFEVHNHHNFAWEEDGLIVVRKGATPLTEDPAFIGGSMGDVSVIVRGTGEDIGALASAPHGAGRVMSRTQAAGKWMKQRVTRTAPDGTTYEKKIRVRNKATAAIDWDAVRADLDERGIVVLGAGADEAPGVYKSLEAVLSHHPNIEVLHRLEPLGVVMAGEDEFDPYKD